MVLICAFVSTSSNLHASRFEFWKQTWIVVLVWFSQFGTYMQVPNWGNQFFWVKPTWSCAEFETYSQVSSKLQEKTTDIT